MTRVSFDPFVQSLISIINDKQKFKQIKRGSRLSKKLELLISAGFEQAECSEVRFLGSRWSGLVWQRKLEYQKKNYELPQKKKKKKHA